MTGRVWLASGAFVVAAAVIAGAFGAHGLKARLDADALALWETAARYATYAGMALMAIGLTGLVDRSSSPSTWLTTAPWLLSAGGMIFSGTVAALALGGPRWLGAVTPLGGLLMILGLVLFGIAALQLT